MSKKVIDKEQIYKLAERVQSQLYYDKAEDVKIIDLQGKADFADYIVIATGRSSRHISALADNLVDLFKEKGVENIGVEGQAKGDWVLVDAHDIIVHIFRKEIRDIYDLDKMWSFTIKP